MAQGYTANVGRAGTGTQAKVQAKFRENPKFSLIPYTVGRKRESIPFGLFKFRKKSVPGVLCVCLAYVIELSDLIHCLFLLILGSGGPLLSLSGDRDSSKLLASKHPKIHDVLWPQVMATHHRPQSCRPHPCLQRPSASWFLSSTGLWHLGRSPSG